MNPGDIHWADLEFAGRRPVIVLSRESLNRGDTVVAVPCTTQGFERRSRLSNCVSFEAGQFGFRDRTVAQCENVQVVEKQALDPARIGRLDDEKLRELIRASARSSKRIASRSDAGPPGSARPLVARGGAP